MKKFFIAIAVAALALSACSKVEINQTEGPGKKVTFQAVNYLTQTKAESVIPEFTSFKALAYLHAEGVDIINGTDQGTKQPFFGNGETITVDNVENPTEWAPSSHTYYWPKGESSYVDFIGWYGTSEPEIDYDRDNNGTWTATMTWDFESQFGQATSNLMYADMAWRFKENNVPATYGPVSGVSEGVPMLFHHALAQINIKAYVAGDAENQNPLTPADADEVGEGVTDGTATWTVTIEEATIGDINMAGTLELTNTDPGTPSTPKAWDGEWEGSDDAGPVVIDDCEVDKVTKDDATDLVAPSCVLPQPLDDVTLSFKVRIVTTYNDDPSNPNEEVLSYSIKLSDMGTDAWAMNTKYTYYIKIVPNQNKVLFDPALEAGWDEVEAGEAIL